MTAAVPVRNQVCAYKPSLLLRADVSGLFECRSATMMMYKLLYNTPHTQAHHSLGHTRVQVTTNFRGQHTIPPEFPQILKVCLSASFPASYQHDSRGSDSLHQLPPCED